MNFAILIRALTASDALSSLGASVPTILRALSTWQALSDYVLWSGRYTDVDIHTTSYLVTDSLHKTSMVQDQSCFTAGPHVTCETIPPVLRNTSLTKTHLFELELHTELLLLYIIRNFMHACICMTYVCMSTKQTKLARALRQRKPLPRTKSQKLPFYRQLVYRLSVWHWNLFQGHRGWHHRTAHMWLPISVL